MGIKMVIGVVGNHVNLEEWGVSMAIGREKPRILENSDLYELGDLPVIERKTKNLWNFEHRRIE